MSIHCKLNPIPVLLRKAFLYNFSIPHGDYVMAELIAVASYPGSVITFSAKITETGAIFSYLPAHAFCDRRSAAPASMVSMQASGSPSCPDENVHLSYWGLGEVAGYWPIEDRVVQGKYILTLDWPDSNELYHMFVGYDGEFYFRPNHKLLIDGTKESRLPPYKKLKIEWNS
jgi:hypothetical protein